MDETTADSSLHKYWWLGLMQGIMLILFGIAALFWPGLTLVTLVYLFSINVLVWGIVEIIKSLMRMDGFVGMWWLTLLFGVFALGVGVYLVRHPGVSFKTLILLIGFTFIVRGIFDIVANFFERQSAPRMMLGIIAGILAVIVGVVVLNQPVAGGVAFVWILGLYSLIVGPTAIALSLESRNLIQQEKSLDH